MSSQKNNPIINIEQTKQIIWQLQNNICKIYSDSGNGTGFFCKIPYPDQFKLLPVLITNNHVLNEEDIKLFKTIKLTITLIKIYLLILKDKYLQMRILILL